VLPTSRPLSCIHPDIEKKGVEHFAEHQSATRITADIAKCLPKIVGPVSDSNNSLLVVGCGPNPLSMLAFREHGFRVFGVEPIADFVAKANAVLGDEVVRSGVAEALPFGDQTQDFYIAESVLEHVESPRMTLKEAYRVLKRGGVAYLYTTNRYHFSIRGDNGEYSIPFFNWLPTIVKESYYLKHLHADPTLANYTPRPAVHWFCYSDLCALGRDVGFYQFFSLLDLVDDDASMVSSSRLRSKMLKRVRSNVFLRSLALLQFGGSIFMCKR
jgi:ubiquinone/menaquinone biosynthesis C-methylase UbiE